MDNKCVNIRGGGGSQMFVGAPLSFCSTYRSGLTMLSTLFISCTATFLKLLPLPLPQRQGVEKV